MASAELAGLYDELRVLSPFNEASGATIYSARDVARGVPVAIKEIDKQHLLKSNASKVEERLRSEVAALRATAGVAGVCPLLECLERGSRLYLVMQLCGGRQLFEEVASRAQRRLREDEGQALMRALVAAVKGIHDAGYIHRDLKPENVLVEQNGESWTVNIVDFGAAKALESEAVDEDATEECALRAALTASVSGTVAWNATPERCYAEAESTAADVWALGGILFFMLVGNAPFMDLSGADADEERILDAVTEEPLHWPAGSPVSSEARQLTEWLLEKDAFDRPTLDQILEHPWLANKNAQA